ncbi:hypothetical protein OA42_05985 [Klebsiella michiganensis]|nr:hypothetical protein OA42_05985 [Klebsiella michiganensis]
MPSGTRKCSCIVILITRRFHVALLAAVVISDIVSLTRVWLSFFIDSAPAIVVFTAVFIAVFLMVMVKKRPKIGCSKS